MKRVAKVALAILAAAHCVGDVRATGYFGPSVYLDEGGKNVDASPEFYWELEVKRLAREFRPREFRPIERLLPPTKEETQGNKDPRTIRSQNTAEADLKDFADALKAGQIKPPDPARATQQHQAARNLIDKIDNATALPEEFNSEFADYHRGAFAYRRGQEHWDEARKAWQELLNRPEQDRHYRTVWAAFMLGKLALKSQDPEAVKWFQRTRELARTGFADSLGMAADSYGWEGRSEWKQEHPANAAAVFLTQLALGDESAIVSIKALIPDREPIEGMLNYGPELEERSKWDDQRKGQQEQKEISKLKEAAQDPVLRRLVTVHILATASSPDFYGGELNSTSAKRCARWLEVIKAANLEQVEDAEYLGWAAYTNGDYKSAARWLDLSKGDTPAACWLRAKLQRREGKLAEAAKSMAKAWQIVRDTSTYIGWAAPQAPVEDEYGTYPDRGRWTFEQSASGDLGGLHLARGDFVQALDILLKGKLWEDAAYVAERVLTANELKAYIEHQLDASAASGGKDDIAKLRYLLGRRLVREDRYAEAAAYLRPPYNKILEKYVRALKNGANNKLSKAERARSLFTAAWLARYDGMELMGTEGAPDGFSQSGDFELPDLAQQRQTGTYKQVRYTQKGREEQTAPVVLRASKQERDRLASNQIRPNTRFHYRLIAGALAIKAAALLPNDSEELADVVNRAGLWVKDRDEKIGNRYYQIIEQRCPKTEIGRAAIEKHWFVDQSGPWSTAQRETYDALHKELNLTTSAPE
jgi:hypothetical protein